MERNIEKDTVLALEMMPHGTKRRAINCAGSAALCKLPRETCYPIGFNLVKVADHGGSEFWTERIRDIVDAFCKKCFGRQ